MRTRRNELIDVPLPFLVVFSVVLHCQCVDIPVDSADQFAEICQFSCDGTCLPGSDVPGVSDHHDGLDDALAGGEQRRGAAAGLHTGQYR